MQTPVRLVIAVTFCWTLERESRLETSKTGRVQLLRLSVWMMRGQWRLPCRSIIRAYMFLGCRLIYSISSRCKPMALESIQHLCSLLSPVRETPLSHSIYSEEHGMHVPLTLNGFMSGFTCRKPTFVTNDESRGVHRKSQVGSMQCASLLGPLLLLNGRLSLKVAGSRICMEG